MTADQCMFMNVGEAEAVDEVDKAEKSLHTLHCPEAKYPQIVAIRCCKAEAPRVCEGSRHQEWNQALRLFLTALKISIENDGKDRPHEDIVRALLGLARTHLPIWRQTSSRSLVPALSANVSTALCKLAAGRAFEQEIQQNKLGGCAVS